MDWTWQGILTGLLATGLWAVGATVLTWIKNKWPKYGDLALYWAASFACFGIVWFALTGYVPFARHQIQTTPENIESNLKTWFEDVNLPLAKTSVQDAYFGYSVSTRSGTQIQVTRMVKDKPAYLQFITTITFSPEHQAVMGTLTKDQADTVVQEITVELAKMRVGFTIATMNLPQTGINATGQTAIVLQKGEPIASLNEARLASCIDDMEFTTTLARSAVSLALRRATRVQTKNGAIVHVN